MVVIYEYRIPLPFTTEEYEIAQLYMVAKYSASESTGDNGDGVEILKNEPFEEGNRKGQYTHKVYHLASKLPSWLVSLLPKKALMLEEEAWNAYPHCTTVLKCPFLNKFKLILDSTHVADRGDNENALQLDPKTLKKRQVEWVDIAMDQPEKYVEEEDPSLFRSKKTGRGPLLRGWQERCEPLMCAYKCVTVDVPYWGFGSRIEKFVAKNAQRKILLEGHRKCFCWLDEWFGATMEDVRRMEYETAEAIKRARTIALSRAQVFADDDVGVGLASLSEDAACGVAVLDTPDSTMLDPASGLHKDWGSNPGTPRMKVSPAVVPNPRRRPSLSLVGPSFSVGIATLSAIELDQSTDCNPGQSEAPPAPPTGTWKSSSTEMEPHQQPQLSSNFQSESNLPTLRTMPSCESFSDRQAVTEDWDEVFFDFEDQSSPEVSKCVDVLDRVIAWTKALRMRKSARNGTFGPGIVAPVDSSGEMVLETKDDLKHSEVDQYIGVLNSALSAVTRKQSKNKVA